MKILVIDIAASEGGALSILKEFYNYVKLNDYENEYIFWLGGDFLEPTEKIQVEKFESVKKSRLRKIYFDFFKAKKIINKIKPDLIFSMQNIIAFGVKQIPQVVYMHQSIPFQTMKSYSFFKHNERTLAIVQHLIGRIIKLSIKKADFTIVQTKWVMKAVIEQTNISSDKIIDIFPDVEKVVLMENKELSFKTFFYPATKEEYKNHDCIYKAVEILRSLGVSDFKIYLTVEGEDTENIIHLGRVEHEDVIKRLSRSVLLFPSYIETVGLPLLEGKMVGTLIIASDTAFSHEILDDYENKYYFDPFSSLELAEIMQKVIEEDVNFTRNTEINTIQEKPGWRKIIEVLEEVFNENQNKKR